MSRPSSFPSSTRRICPKSRRGEGTTAIGPAEAVDEVLAAALVAAAQLSHRYISDRVLPDRAIDLVDEAAAKLRTEMESMPEELEQFERRLMQLEIEHDALKAQWDAEKSVLGDIQKLREAIEVARNEMEKAQRQGDLVAFAIDIQSNILILVHGEARQRRMVSGREIWLQKESVIAITQNKKALPNFLEKIAHH